MMMRHHQANDAALVTCMDEAFGPRIAGSEMHQWMMDICLIYCSFFDLKSSYSKQVGNVHIAISALSRSSNVHWPTNILSCRVQFINNIYC